VTEGRPSEREPVADPAAAAAARGLRWAYDGQALVTVWRGHDFAAALGFVARVGALAERAGHHPDVDIRYASVTLRLWSHDVGAVTSRDLDLAAAVDAAVDDGGGANQPPGQASSDAPTAG